MYKEIFFASAILLGIFIIINHFLNNDPPLLKSDTSYHIGCYDSSTSHNHSSQIQKKLRDLQEIRNHNIKLNMYNSIALNQDFPKKVQGVAMSFENYLDQYYRQKIQNEQDLHYYNSLKIAKHNYIECVGILTLNEDECHDAWKQYREVSIQFDNLKKSLAQLIERKQKQESRIAAAVLEHQDMDQDEIQKSYNIKVAEISYKIKQFEEQMVLLQSRKNKIVSDNEKISAQLQKLQQLRNKCPENKNLIVFCKSINSYVNKFGSKVQESRAGLPKRILVKQKIMDSLQSGIRKLKKYGNSEQLRDHEREYEKHKKQLALLNSEISSFETIEESICKLCSEQKIQELDKNITQLLKQISENKKSIQKLSFEIDQVQEAKKKLDKSLFDAHQQFQAQINSMFCLDDKCKQEQKQKFREFEQNLGELKKEIIDQEVQINFIKGKVQDKIRNLHKYLKQISEAENCRRTKQYYQQLLKLEPKHQTGDKTIILAQEKVIKDLNQFDL